MLIFKSFQSRIHWNSLKYSTESSSRKKLYNHTIFLPKTGLPLRLDNEKRVQRDIEIAKTAEFDMLYSWQRGHLSEPEFVLHDGPPYANGKLHMGHAINKILKDVILRYHIVNGNKVHYIPGWDCHGLPIELKAVSKNESDPIEIRNKARTFAQRTIEKQKKAFKTWGITGDWDNHYATYDPSYYKTQFKIFHKLYKEGLIYRDFKPVHWSPSTQTALAEAELEYDDKYKSPSAYVRFRINEIPNLFALIWTTTPWTLPSNQAICYGPTLQYSIVENPKDNQNYILATESITELSKVLNTEFKVIEEMGTHKLSKFTYIHPIFKEKTLKFLQANHVTASKGTGLVHTAPAHGPDDYIVALNNKMQIVNLVDERGCYTSDAGSDLRGKFVLKEGGDSVLHQLGHDLLHLGELIHSYPCDWRTKQPVIIKASQQWFVDTNAIKSRAVELLEDVEILPKLTSDNHKSNLINQLKQRPYWCISRQRFWGVPVPVLSDKNTSKILIDDDIINNFCQLIDEYGTDFWWKLPVSQLIPNDLKDCLDVNNLVKSSDILDIWFDSGVSWAKVMEGNKVADLYLEGVDQFTGWFQSSLITSVAFRDKSPYKKVYVHGYVVDDKGMKMSKSEGNIVDPSDVIKRHGVDTLRWWAACHGNQDSITRINSSVLQTSSNEVQRIRSTLRFAIGCLDDYRGENVSDLSLLDRYLMHLLVVFQEKVDESSISYEFHRINMSLNQLLTQSISALYYTSIKDRLYCDDLDSRGRQSCQFVLYNIFQCIARAVAPIIPHLIEEIYFYLPNSCKKSKTYYTSNIVKLGDEWKNPRVEEIIDFLLLIKRDINKQLGADTTGFSAKIVINSKLWRELEDSSVEIRELEDIFQVSHVDLSSSVSIPINSFSLELFKSHLHQCPRCRRFNSLIFDDLCPRCREIVIN